MDRLREGKGSAEPIAKVPLVSAEDYPKEAAIAVVSRDANFVAFAYDVKQLYRHSYYAQWEICAVPSMACSDLLASSVLSGQPADAEKDVRLVLWSPNSVDRVAYVWHNDLSWPFRSPPAATRPPGRPRPNPWSWNGKS